MRIALFSALCIAAVASACSTSTGADEQLLVNAKTSLAKFKSGEAVVVTITVTNESNAAIDLPVVSCPTHFAVRDANGAIVGPPSDVCTQQSVVKTFAPGEKLEYVSTWRGEGFATAQGVTTFLKPGIYTVDGFFGIKTVNTPATVEITS